MEKLLLVLILTFGYLVVNNAFQIQPRIVNGSKANVSQFPYFAHLIIQTSQNDTDSKPIIKGCGATLISDEWLLTAAHCISQGEKLNAFLGTIRKGRNNYDRGYLMILVDKKNFHIHPQYEEQFNDIGLFIRL